MTDKNATLSSSAEGQDHLDGLIARYSVLGAERRRKRRRVWVGRSVLATGAIGAAVAAAFADLDLSALQPGLEELRTLHSTMTTELAAFQAGRVELEEQQAWLELQSAELSSRLIE